MKPSALWIAPLFMLANLSGCSDAAETTEDVGDGAEEVGDETEDAADEVADETGDAAEEVGDAAEEVGEEVEETAQDADAELDCAAVCDAQKDCASGIDEDVCLATCENVAVDGEGNETDQAGLDACDDCVDAADDARCTTDGDFVCAAECDEFING